MGRGTWAGTCATGSNPVPLAPVNRDIPPLRAGAFWRLAATVVLFATLGVGLASLLAVGIVTGARASEAAWAGYLVARPEAVVRRCLIAVAAIFLFGFLRRAGWGGVRDCGWRADDPERATMSWWSLALRGALLGLITLGGISLMLTAVGWRYVNPVADGVSPWSRVGSYLLSGMAVAVLEETVCRGILFRVLARLWRPWIAAWLGSLMFAWAHFLEPSPEAFAADAWPSRVGRVFMATLTAIGTTEDPLPRFVNLTLLGLVLCAFVRRTGTIWLGVGAHAAWVWAIKLNAYLTDVALGAPASRWWGNRSDFMDGFAATVVLAVLGAVALRRVPAEGAPLTWRKVLWRVTPEARAQLGAWLERWMDDDPRGAGRVLKAYDGCRVTAAEGWVLKAYWPRTDWRGWRFAVRPSRTRRAFILGRALSAAGVPTPAPVAWSATRAWGCTRAEYLLVEEAAESGPLTDWLRRQVSDASTRAGVMAAYGRLAAAFHAAGYSNRDLKHENVLCATADPARLTVVDLDGVRRVRMVGWRRAARDLRRIGLSLASLGWTGEGDRQAFFEGYNARVPVRLKRETFPL